MKGLELYINFIMDFEKRLQKVKLELKNLVLEEGGETTARNLEALYYQKYKVFIHLKVNKRII
jgi:hypothetical protein